ncbi:MAG: HAMP domain-containing protein [Nocardioidaceae bacterium]|nr:HAMP domain-containing protein [Nocardioidaceae bacterium]
MSLRTRITLVASLLSAVVLAAGSVLLVVRLDHSLTTSSDRASLARLAEMAAQVRDGSLCADLPDAGDGLVQVVGDDGSVLAASPNLRGQPAIATFTAEGSPVLRQLRAPDDQETEEYRVWARHVTGPGGSGTVYVGDSTESVREATAGLRHLLYVAVPGGLAVTALATWLLVGRALRPVERIRADVAAISSTDLGRRVPEPPSRDEVGRLARTMNAMLARLEEARAREHEFVADASHELLSPLAATRAMLESGDDPSPAALLAENAGMERIVRQLLFLARDQAGTRPVLTGVDLDDLVLEEAARLRAITPVVVDTSGVSAGPVHGDREELRHLVRNLLENAARHATGTVTVGVALRDETVRLDVLDDGPGVEPGLREQVFERFTRGEHRRDGGAGLGLAIVRTVAERLGGEVELLDGSGAHFQVRLPAHRG